MTGRAARGIVLHHKRPLSGSGSTVKSIPALSPEPLRTREHFAGSGAFVFWPALDGSLDKGRGSAGA